VKKALNLLVATAAFGLLVIGLWGLASGASAAAPAHFSAPALQSASTSSRPLPAPPGVAAPLTPLCNPDWSVVPSPNVGAQSSYLYGVAVVSSSDVWAVGYYLNSNFNQITLVEHWDGTAWNVVASPNAGTSSYLSGVAAISSSDVWAVGNYSNGTVGQTLVEHWDGTAWAIVPSPAPGLSNSYLSGVAAISSSDVWAVGEYTGATQGQTLVEHWDGTAWNVVASPNVGTSDNVLQGIAAISSNDVWAVGNSSNGFNVPHQTLVEHWDGTAWNVVSSPNVGVSNNVLAGITAISSSDVWAVGGYYNASNNYQTLTEHWDGTAWNVVSSPNVGTNGSYLAGIAAISSSDVWAVGDYLNASNDYQTLVEHWDGTAWSVVSSPNVGTSGSYLQGVAAISSSDIWAVGAYDFGTTDVKTLVERYNPCPPTPTVTETPVVATATPTLTRTNTPVPPTSTPTSTPSSTPRPNFSINISPTVATINRPGSVIYTVTLTSLNGFSGRVDLSVCGLPIQTDGIFIRHP
jgi:hypothetical protein